MCIIVVISFYMIFSRGVCLFIKDTMNQSSLSATQAAIHYQNPLKMYYYGRLQHRPTENDREALVREQSLGLIRHGNPSVVYH